MPTPLDIARRPRPAVLPVRLAWTTTTGDRPLVERAPRPGTVEACPGSNGEISSASCRQVYGDRCCCW